MCCADALPEAQRSEPRVWVFCTTIPPLQLLYLASSVRRYSSGSRLLLLGGFTAGDDEGVLFHRILNPTDGVDELMCTISELSFQIRMSKTADSC